MLGGNNRQICEFLYRELKGVYAIGFLNFCIFEDDEVRHDVQLVDMKTEELFYDKLTFIYLEMPDELLT